MADLLGYSFLGIMVAVIAVVGWLWNIIIVVAVVHNGLPVTMAIQVFSLLPFGLSVHFTYIGLRLSLLWYRDFQEGHYDDNTDWFGRLIELETKSD